MLLPAKFQTPTPAPLGAKVVAIAPAPKPHVHQWVSVPDSKIHSRCAECGTVTLTEIVAPKVSFCPDDTHVAARLAAGAGQWVVGVDPAAPGSDRTVFSEHFLGKPYSFVDLLRTPELAPPTNKTATEILMEYAASRDRMAALHRGLEQFAPPPRHYTSIITLDGRVRMVETDAEGWIKNDGTQPVASGVKVECRLRAAQSKGVAPADEWRWRDTGTEWSITHWRPAA